MSFTIENSSSVKQNFDFEHIEEDYDSITPQGMSLTYSGLIPTYTSLNNATFNRSYGMDKRDFIFDDPEVDQFFRQLLHDSQRLSARQKITKRKLQDDLEHALSDNLMVRYLAIVLRPIRNYLSSITYDSLQEGIKLRRQVLAYEHRLLFDDDGMLVTDSERLIRKWKAGIYEVAKIAMSMKNFMDSEEFKIYRCKVIKIIQKFHSAIYVNGGDKEFENALNDYLVNLVEDQKARLQMTADLDVAALQQNLRSNIKSSNKSFDVNLLEANYLEIASKLALLLSPDIEESGGMSSRIQGSVFLNLFKKNSLLPFLDTLIDQGERMKELLKVLLASMRRVTLMEQKYKKPEWLKDIARAIKKTDGRAFEEIERQASVEKIKIDINDSWPLLLEGQLLDALIDLSEQSNDEGNLNFEELLSSFVENIIRHPRLFRDISCTPKDWLANKKKEIGETVWLVSKKIRVFEAKVNSLFLYLDLEKFSKIHNLNHLGKVV